MNPFASIRFVLVLLMASVLTACASAPVTSADPLPSWNDGASKQRIIEFVEAVSDPQSDQFVPAAERIAVYDNDGTLWSERPVYFQLYFAMDQIRAMVDDHPEWRSQEPFKSVLEGDLHGVAATGEAGIMMLVAESHSGMSTEAFSDAVTDWLETARHPDTGQRYTDMVYQPMLEVLAYMEANGFTNFIVSGGGMDFMRPWAREVYGLPPNRVIGSHLQLKYTTESGTPMIIKQGEFALIDDKAGKPVGIHRFIGQRPIAAFGNSDGDFQMLEWTTAGEGPRLGVFVHHTDGEREWAYDRDSHVGRLQRGLDEAAERNWLLVDMARDWRVIYPDG